MIEFRLFAILCLTVPLAASAGDAWPEFRGPNGTGLALDANLPTDFGEKSMAWKTPIHGKGWASPVVMEGKIWIATATEDGKEMSAICVDAATGKVLHDEVLFKNAEPEFAHATNSYASCTPAVEPGQVYFHFGHYGTACLDTTTFKTVWTRRDIECDEFRGPGSSPVLYENLLIFNCDGFDAQFVIALDTTTGETVWRKERDIDYGTDNGDFKKAYSTPTIFETAEGDVLVSPAAIATIAYDPHDGRELWRVRQGYMNAAARPLKAGDIYFIAAGKDDTSLIALAPTGSGEQTGQIVWGTNKGVSQRPTPLIVGENLYMVADEGVASCRDVKTGEIHWMKRLGGEYWASPVSDGKNVFACGKEGRVVVFAAKPEFELVADHQFDEGFHATPAIVDNALILRSRNHLYRIEQP